ncbi:VCP-like ATPase [Heterostelium album PN500]|uniref:VCP-like ATPase n=1 Tax=Heterostelium pallidum (strain ATCC 26659 / Pp 5 / PN500) TaxID=670386 RepID=D3BVI5_HETP5|nr:VCP-like ATPase [Heterostelium album PN500]EFA74608.1 VCP-like ATPase [Heterostelium album PN500]|eukprot:XP_020426742.1 VCP-like ATPase [Heterostelium album PN500]
MSLELFGTFESNLLDNHSNDDKRNNNIEVLISNTYLKKQKLSSTTNQFALLISVTLAKSILNNNNKEDNQDNQQQIDNNNNKQQQDKIILIELKPCKFTSSSNNFNEASLPHWMLLEFNKNNNNSTDNDDRLYKIEIIPLYSHINQITNQAEKQQLYCSNNTEIVIESLDSCSPLLDINQFNNIENHLRLYLSDKPIILESTFRISINNRLYRFKIKDINNQLLDTLLYFPNATTLSSSSTSRYKLTFVNNNISKDNNSNDNNNNNNNNGNSSNIKDDLKSEIESIQSLLKLKKEIGSLNLCMKGILISGAPGTQISELARYICKDKSVIHLNSKSFSSTLNFPIVDSNSSNGNSNQVIYLFENIESIGSRVNESNDTTNHALLRLCNFIDNRISSDHLLLATTSNLSSVDQSLLRAGRLDKIISLPIPSQSSRQLILQSILSNTSIIFDDDEKAIEKEKQKVKVEEVDDKLKVIQQLARKTPGFVYQDLKKLCIAAALNSIERQVDGEDGCYLTMKDFDDALLNVRASNLMHFDVELPNVAWESVGGYEKIKQRFKELIEWPLLHGDTFQRLALTHGASSGVLLHGPSGCGKTLLVKAVATKMNVNFISIKGSDIYSKWLGESERIIRDIFERARLSAPCILFFDEIDSLGLARSVGGEDGGGGQNRIITQLLNEMDGIQTKSKLFLIGCTTRADLLDAGLVRPGRLETQIYVGLPTADDRRAILQSVIMKRMKFDHDVDIDSIITKTEGFTCAQLITLCNDAGINALKENINSKTIKNKHFIIN